MPWQRCLAAFPGCMHGDPEVQQALWGGSVTRVRVHKRGSIRCGPCPPVRQTFDHSGSTQVQRWSPREVEIALANRTATRRSNNRLPASNDTGAVHSPKAVTQDTAQALLVIMFHMLGAAHLVLMCAIVVAVQAQAPPPPLPAVSPPPVTAPPPPPPGVTPTPPPTSTPTLAPVLTPPPPQTPAVTPTSTPTASSAAAAAAVRFVVPGLPTQGAGCRIIAGVD